MSCVYLLSRILNLLCSFDSISRFHFDSDFSLLLVNCPFCFFPSFFKVNFCFNSARYFNCIPEDCQRLCCCFFVKKENLIFFVFKWMGNEISIKCTYMTFYLQNSIWIEFVLFFSTKNSLNFTEHWTFSHYNLEIGEDLQSSFVFFFEWRQTLFKYFQILSKNFRKSLLSDKKIGQQQWLQRQQEQQQLSFRDQHKRIPKTKSILILLKLRKWKSIRSILYSILSRTHIALYTHLHTYYVCIAVYNK